MPKQISSPLKSAQQGVVLVEAMIAIVIFSIGVLGIVGMQANMIKNTADAKFRADASNIAQQKIGQIWSDPSNAAALAENNLDISSILPGGRRTTTVAATPTLGFLVTVTVNWQEPGGDPHSFTTTANIAGG